MLTLGHELWQARWPDVDLGTRAITGGGPMLTLTSYGRRGGPMLTLGHELWHARWPDVDLGTRVMAGAVARC